MHDWTARLEFSTLAILKAYAPRQNGGLMDGPTETHRYHILVMFERLNACPEMGLYDVDRRQPLGRLDAWSL